MQENEKYFSQSLQDEFVDKVIFNKKRQGYFVEIGAHDGISFSNTYFLEKFRNFNGLCIEPNPNVYKRLVNNRNCQTKQVCISNKAGEVDFLLMEGSSEMLSGIYNEYHPDHMRRINNLKLENSAKKVIKVETLPFQDIIDPKVSEIDYLSIDTEGNEFSILECIDFSKFQICCLSIENNYDDRRIDELLRKNGYFKIFRTGDDDIFVKGKINTSQLKARKFLFIYSKKIQRVAERLSQKFKKTSLQVK